MSSLQLLAVASVLTLCACGADDGVVLGEVSQPATGAAEPAASPSTTATPPAPADSPEGKVAAANGLLTERCLPCHDGSDPSSGQIDFIDDLQHLGEPFVVPGNPEASVLFARVSLGEMPPVYAADEFPVVSGDELQLLRDAIEALPLDAD